MDTWSQLRSLARRIYFTALGLLLPLVLGVVISLAGDEASSGLVGWCVKHLWHFAVLAAVVVLAGFVVPQWRFRCPTCNYLLSRAGIGVAELTFKSSGIKYCPHCGVSAS